MLAFAFSPTSIPVLALLFVAVGTSTALVETAEGSHAPELLPEAIRGRAFGLIGLVDGVGDLVSSVTVGAKPGPGLEAEAAGPHRSPSMPRPVPTGSLAIPSPSL